MTRISILFGNDWNLGDHLSARGIQASLGTPARYVPFEGNPQAFSYLSTLHPNDLVIIGGGGLLKHTFDDFWRALIELRSKVGFRTAIWGVGRCDVLGLDTTGDQGLHAQAIAGSVAVAVRDQASAAAHPGVDVIPCPAHRSAFDLRGRIPPTMQRTLLFLRHDGLLEALERHRDAPLLASEIQTSLRCVAQRTGLAYDEFDNTVSRSALDRRLSGRLAQRSGAARRAVRSMRASTATGALIERYGPAAMIVSSRLHGAILGISLGLPVVALSADTKIDAYFASIDRSEWVSDDPVKLVQLLRAADEQQPLIERVRRICADNATFGRRLLRHAR